jgi:hypothetical protein
VISPTLKKLRYKPGARVHVVGATAAFEAELAEAEGVERADKLEKELDLIQAFYTRRAHLERDVARLKEAMGSSGVLWICYPKARGLGTDLNRDVIRRAVARFGLEAVAIVAVDRVWSAMRCKRVR